MLMPARSVFNVCRFFSMRANTELTKPAPWPFVFVGETIVSESKISAMTLTGTNLFIKAPKPLSPLVGSNKKPSNYRERLLYVNLKAECFAVAPHQSADSEDLGVTSTGKGFDLLFDFQAICFTCNNFGTQNNRLLDWAWMRECLWSFAIFEPAFRCQKYENQTNHTQKIPLPSVSSVIPEENLLQCG
jgi:hypothetical protein